MKLTVLLSGSGSNFQAILDAIASGYLTNVQVVKVIADRECQGINRAIQQEIPFAVVSRKREDFQDILLEEIPQESDLVVCAGFLSIIPQSVVEAFPRKIINIHPSLLPKYGGKGMYGMHVHRAVVENGETESGCTVHYVDTGVDTGEMILQKKVPVYADDTAEEVQKRVLVEEHKALPEVIKLLG